MATLKVIVRLRSPLLAGDSRPGSYGERSALYLSGSVLRGALGAKLAAECGHPLHSGSEGCEYARIFCSPSPPRFSPCYPAFETIPLPFPATARTCKHYPGLLDTEDKNKHGVRDCLFATYLLEEQIERGRHVEIPVCEREGCGADLDPIQGFYEYSSDGKRYQPHLWIQRLSKTAIDRARCTAADELLYTMEIIADQMATGRRGKEAHEVLKPTQLMGVVVVDETRSPLLAQRLREIEYLGGDSGRGLGLVSIEVQAHATPKREIPQENIRLLALAARAGTEFSAVRGSCLAAQLALFNAALRSAHGTDLPWPPGSLFFSIDLLSDTIWPHLGLPSDSLPEELHGASLVKGFSSARPLSGWNVGSGTMRSPRRAITAGSVFLYRFDHAGDPAALRILLDALSTLESEGAGDDRERGFGFVKICSAFHQEAVSL